MVPLRYSPGDQWVYGLGHDVQAYLVEHFSGMPYADYVREAILEPLGMRHTAFGVPQALKGQFAIAIVIWARSCRMMAICCRRWKRWCTKRSWMRHKPVVVAALKMNQAALAPPPMRGR